MNTRKPAKWVGTTLEDLKTFPTDVIKEMGYDLNLVQQGLLPRDFKVMQNLGSGVMEIRQRDETGAYRLIYVAKFADAIYCLHAFQKKSQKTAPKDIEIIKARYRAILELDHD